MTKEERKIYEIKKMYNQVSKEIKYMDTKCGENLCGGFWFRSDKRKLLVWLEKRLNRILTIK